MSYYCVYNRHHRIHSLSYPLALSELPNRLPLTSLVVIHPTEVIRSPAAAADETDQPTDIAESPPSRHSPARTATAARHISSYWPGLI
jgi:hypothetical protein